MTGTSTPTRNLRPAPPSRPIVPSSQTRRPICYVGSFGLIREIGSGGMGVAWEAEDLLGRPFCVKMIHPEFGSHPEMRERLRREARALAQVRHDNVIPIHHYEEVGGLCWIVMPLLRGETVAARLERQGSSPLPELLQLGAEAAAGLAALHAGGVIHRDIKPSNLFLQRQSEQANERVVIMDLGLALRQGDEPLTSPGIVPCTPGFVSPERLAGERGTASCDIYGLGVTLWQLATGVRSVTDSNRPSWLAFVRGDQDRVVPRSPREERPELPAELDALIVAMLDRRPENRPTADEVAETLTGLQRRNRAPQAA